MTNAISWQFLANVVNFPISDGPCYHNPASIHLKFTTATANSMATGFSKNIKIFAILPGNTGKTKKFRHTPICLDTDSFWDIQFSRKAFMV